MLILDSSHVSRFGSSIRKRFFVVHSAARRSLYSHISIMRGIITELNGLKKWEATAQEIDRVEYYKLCQTDTGNMDVITEQVMGWKLIQRFQGKSLITVLFMLEGRTANSMVSKKNQRKGEKRCNSFLSLGYMHMIHGLVVNLYRGRDEIAKNTRLGRDSRTNCP